jgi:hypothetical protein
MFYRSVDTRINIFMLVAEHVFPSAGPAVWECVLNFSVVGLGLKLALYLALGFSFERE